MRLMCFFAAATVAIGSLAVPVNAWADDDDDFLEDLDNLSDDEIEVLLGIQDHDGDGDIDEEDVEAIRTIITIGALAEADRQYEAELEAARRAQQAALDAQKRAEEEKKRLQKVSGIWVSTTDVTLTPGQTYQLIAGVTPDSARNRGVHFSTSNWNVAGVDGSGIIRANSVGSCCITATSDDGGYCARKVNPAVAAAAQTISQDANWTTIAANLILTAAPGEVLNLVAPKALSFDAGMINALKMRPDVG